MLIPPVGPEAAKLGLGDLLNAFRNALLELSEPTYPHPVFAALEADLPRAADYPNCPVWVTDLAVMKISNGVSWVSI
jgi:hypothetical protein